MKMVVLKFMKNLLVKSALTWCRSSRILVAASPAFKSWSSFTEPLVFWGTKILVTRVVRFFIQFGEVSVSAVTDPSFQGFMKVALQEFQVQVQKMEGNSRKLDLKFGSHSHFKLQ